MIIGPLMCMACTRLHHTAAIVTCDAYPTGIPQEILDGASHRAARGDEVDGLVFEMDDTPGAQVAMAAWDAIHDPDDDDPGELDEEQRARAQMRMDEINEDGPDEYEETARAAGADVTPGHDELHHYWTRGKGLAKWAGSPKPWTTLVAHLTKHVGPAKAKVFASRWFIEVFGYAAGSDKNRVAHGHPPRGHRVGPG